MKLFKSFFFLIFFAIIQRGIFPWCQIYFTPRDDIKSHLIEFIKQERKSIDAALYMITDKSISQELINAHLRGVNIHLILDQISMNERFGKGTFLQNNGVSILIHKTQNCNPFCMPLMHHKFFIFGLNSLLKKSLLWTGSFNCTQNASKLNDENVIITDDATVIGEYKNCFIQLSQRLLAKPE
ncbi:hypothetical protein HYV11_03545 [Candidatus Dependentiae bacterium]|nr:hypothetical protein [Candidatus Dependentiae bacterium]